MPKVVVLTGASDGIGAVAAANLVRQGDTVVLVGRSPEKLERVAANVGADNCLTADFEDLASVEALAARIREICPRIDVLANNAGGIFSGPVRTTDGFERSFQVNHLAPVLLTHRLIDILRSSKASVVNTSSIAARLFGRVDTADLNTWNGFSPNQAYGNGKLANILFSEGLHSRFSGEGLRAVAFHPGIVATSFASDTSSYFRVLYHSALKRFLISAEAGGDNLTHFINGVPGEDWVSGEFYGADRKIARTNKQAYDPQLVTKHWERTCEYLQIDDPDWR